MKSFFNGLVSGVLAASMITGIYFGIEYLLPSWNIFNPILYFILSLVGIILLGVGITAFCSWLMVRRYLRMKLDELY
jgi:cell division transport system permease protein